MNSGAKKKLLQSEIVTGVLVRTLKLEINGQTVAITVSQVRKRRNEPFFLSVSDHLISLSWLFVGGGKLSKRVVKSIVYYFVHINAAQAALTMMNNCEGERFLGGSYL